MTKDEKISAAIAPFLAYWEEVKRDDEGMIGDAVIIVGDNRSPLTAKNFNDLEQVKVALTLPNKC